MWIHPEQRPTAGACPGLDAAIKQLQELQTELAQLLSLRRRTAEYQVWLVLSTRCGSCAAISGCHCAGAALPHHVIGVGTHGPGSRSDRARVILYM